MNPIKFEGMNSIYAEEQPEYLNLPSHKTDDGVVTSCWKLSWRERLKVFMSGKIWWSVLTFNNPLQPQKPDLKIPDWIQVGCRDVEKNKGNNAMKDWYEKRIEEPVRDLVRELRNNGFNTESSCGHEKYIQCQYLLDGELEKLHKFLYNYFYTRKEAIDYKIVMTHEVTDGVGYSNLDISFPSLPSKDEWMGKQKEHFVKMRDYFDKQVKTIENDIKYNGKGNKTH